MGSIGRVTVLLVLHALGGCPHDFTLPPGPEASVDRPTSPLDRAAEVAIDQRRDRGPSPDVGCPSPCVTLFAGVGGSRGIADGPLTEARFDWPSSIAVHPSGLLVADVNNTRVRLIAGGQVTTYAGTTAGSADGPIASAQFWATMGVAVHGTDVFVADRYRVREITAGQVTTVAGGLVPGMTDGAPADARFGYLRGLAYHPTLGLLVADSGNSRIRRVTDTQVTTLAGSETGHLDGPTSVALFRDPNDVAVDGAGNIYIADAGGNRIRRIVDGVVETFAGTGAPGFADGPAAQARFSNPVGLTVDASGAVLVAEFNSHRIRRIAGGLVTTVAGSGAEGYRNGPGASAEFRWPMDVAVDAAGVIYVVDSGNNCIRRID